MKIKKSRLPFFLFILISLLLSILLLSDNEQDVSVQVEKINESDGSGTAIIMTGAAARIPQQAALLEELYNRGLLRDVVFISGVSSGALNAVMLNAILTNRISWQEYKNILFSIEGQNVFLSNTGKLPVNTEPARELLRKVVEDRLGYKTIGDLPIMTEISFSNYSKILKAQRVYRMCSVKINSESDTTLNLVDILMASTSIPLVFPPVRIENVTTIPDAKYRDGGIGIDYIPFQALLDFQVWRGEKVKKVFIVSRQAGIFDDFSNELEVLGIEKKRRFVKIGDSLDNMLWRILVNRLEAFAKAAPWMIKDTYVWIPHIEQNFLMLNFNNLEEQYTMTRIWAHSNEPLPLEDFIQLNNNKKEKND